MSSISIEIPTKGVSLNKLYAGVHWTARRKIVNEIKQLVRISIPEEVIDGGQWPTQQVDFWIEAYFKNRPLDSDNLGLMAKIIIDALKGWIITDDDIAHVRWVTMRSYKGGDDRIIVTSVIVD